MPNVVHVVETIARDANGKVRRRSLSAAFAHELDVARRAPRGGDGGAKNDPLRHVLWQMWEELIEHEPLHIDENFFAAGGDSLRAARFLARIETWLGVALTLADAVLHEARHREPSRLIALRASGSRSPLFFFDGDVNGGGLYSRFLAAALDPDQPVYVVRPRGVRGDEIPPCIETIADADAALIASALPAASYRFAGHCNGGVVALEVARRLEAAGATVDVIVLIGASAPNARLEPLWRLIAATSPFVSRDDIGRLY